MNIYNIINPQTGEILANLFDILDSNLIDAINCALAIGNDYSDRYEALKEELDLVAGSNSLKSQFIHDSGLDEQYRQWLRSRVQK